MQPSDQKGQVKARSIREFEAVAVALLGCSSLGWLSGGPGAKTSQETYDREKPKHRRFPIPGQSRNRFYR